MNIGGDLFGLSSTSGEPALSKLPIWEKYSLSKPFFVKNTDDGNVLISAFGRSEIRMDKKLFYSVVAPLFDKPSEYVGFRPDVLHQTAYDGGTIITKTPKSGAECPECHKGLSDDRTAVCEICGNRLCSHCIISSRINRFSQDLCPDCYLQKRNLAVILDD